MTSAWGACGARWLGRVMALAACVVALPVVASSAGVVISQVYGGGGNGGAPYRNDFVELYNAGSGSVSLAGWSVQYTSAAGTSWASQKVALSGSLAPGQYALVQLGSGGAAGVLLPAADFSASFNISATSGKVALVSSANGLPASACPSDPTIVDLVGYGGANCFETAVAAAPSNTTALLRAAAGCTDSGNNSLDFAAGAPLPRNGASPPGSCGAPAAQPIVPVCPAALAVGSGAVIDFALSASDADSAVNAASLQAGSPPGISLTGFSAAGSSGGSAAVRLALDGSVADGSHAVVVQFGNDNGQTAICTIAISVAPVPPAYTPIYTIQGSGATTPLPGARTTRGVVTKVNNNGYFLQDPVGDGDPATSDGIFVFTGAPPYVAAGHRVQISGTVSEFNTGAAANALTAAHPLTEFSNLSSTVFVGTGTVAPTPVTLPLQSVADFERYEGMLVQLSGPLTASQN